MAPYTATLLPLSEHRMGVTDLWQLLEQSLLPSHIHLSQTPLNEIKQEQELPAGLKRAKHHSLPKLTVSH